MSIFRFDSRFATRRIVPARNIIRRTTGGLAITLLSSLLGSFSLSNSAIAQLTLKTTATATEFAQLSSTLEFVPPPLPSRGRPRGRSNGTASRGSCELTGQLPLTALVPVTQVTSETTGARGVNITYDSVFSLTTQANPTFWFYVPYQLADTPLEFVLQDEQNQTLYQSIYQPSPEDSGEGVIRVQIPEGELALAEGDRYHWFFMAYCDKNAPSFVEGWIERSAAVPSVETSPQEIARTYAQNGIWQDALTLVGEQVIAGEANALSDWEALLSSVGLEAIADQRLLDCCEFQSTALKPSNP